MEKKKPAPPSSSSSLVKEKLQFEKKNKNILRLPKNVRIHKRPIPQTPPIASPYAGSSVPKIVYIASTTPFMSAAKRVQKLLQQAERRAMTAALKGANSNNSGGRRGKGSSDHTKMNDKERFSLLAANGRAELQREKVFIKATGRAIDKALDLGRWFEEKNEEYAVQVKTGTVCVVDDILEEEPSEGLHEEGDGHDDVEEGNVTLEGNQSTLQTPANDTTMTIDSELGDSRVDAADPGNMPVTSNKPESKNQKRRRIRRERRASALEAAELPESRTRWVNTVEIAVNLK